MTKITIYDPAMCCSTGICGSDIDQKLVDFASDLDWLKSKGVEIRRINFSQEPAMFVENEQVRAVLDKSGVDGLPVIFADDVLQASGQYPARAELARMAGIENSEAGGTASASSSGCCGGAPAGGQKQTAGCC